MGETRGKRVQKIRSYANKVVWEQKALVSHDGLCRNVQLFWFKKAKSRCSAMNIQH